MNEAEMLAVVVVRDGVVPAGGLECVSECKGRVLAIGSGTAAAADAMRGVATDVRLAELGPFHPGGYAEALRPVLHDEARLVLPASADGRDLAPRLAAVLDRPLHAMAMAVRPDRIEVIRDGGRALHLIVPDGPFVATLQPGVRGVDHHDAEMKVRDVTAPMTAGHDAEIETVLEPDATTIDLTEAARIVAGGGGLDGRERIAQLGQVAERIGASVGATRVVTDRGWVDHRRQIGTTGVVVDPQLYLAFAISGAVQHTSGLGRPRHIVSVNTDASCPMMQLADLAVVGDANAVLEALVRQVSARG